MTDCQKAGAMSQSVSLIEWEKFWAAGAFLRLNADEVLILEGPFENSGDATADFGGLDFFGGEEIWLKARRRLVLNHEELRRSLESQLAPKSLHRNDFTSLRLENFEASFRMVQGKIQREEIEKAVPILKTETSKKPTSADLAHALFSLWNLPMNLNVYGFWNKGQGVIGATPEQLFELDQTTLKTMALAGSSAKTEASERLPLLKDPKEVKEHQIVVDDMAIRLKTLGWLRQEPTRVLELPTLFHLITRFEVTGITRTPKELIRHLHPTPAMGVAPRAYGYQWLKDLNDQKDRGFFGAPLFFRKSNDSSVVLVAIRSLFWNASGSRIYAGCGLVAASQVEREFAEIQTKMESVFQMLGLQG